MRNVAAAIAAIGLLAACEARVGTDDADPAGNAAASGAAAPASAEGKAQAGKLSIDAPGFDLELDIPTGIGDHAEIDSDSRILYPDVKLAGLHVQASDRGGGDNSAVELRFTSPDAPETIARWYGDTARADRFSIRSAVREGEDWVITGNDKERGGPFRVRLAPGQSGGTDGRLTLDRR